MLHDMHQVVDQVGFESRGGFPAAVEHPINVEKEHWTRHGIRPPWAGQFVFVIGIHGAHGVGGVCSLGVGMS